MTAVAPAEPPLARRALRATGLLGAFNDAGVLAAADVHVALRLGRLGGEDDEPVLLAAALATRAPRLGHVLTDLASVAATASTDGEAPLDPRALPWPEPEPWIARVAASPLVAVGEDAAAGVGGSPSPLRLVGAHLYLDRYWREERQVAGDLRARAEAPAAPVDPGLLADGLARLFAGPAPDLQRLAAAAAVLRRLAVVAGGPGTGKTTTVARILALVDEQAAAAGLAPPLVALAAPTGKAAARLGESVQGEAPELEVGAPARARLAALGASTLHRLLGWRPDSRTRFRHHRGNRLPHDLVVVDESSMVSLSLMARLLEAVRPDARLVLVGDPRQLASVEAGAVLGDVVGPAAHGLLVRAQARAALAAATRQQVDATDPPGAAAIGDGIVTLHRVHRFGAGIAALAEAVRRGDAEGTLAALRAGGDHVRWLASDVGGPASDALLEPVRAAAVDAGARVREAARGGDAGAAVEALGAFRLLCAHRRGDHGVARWNARLEGWLAAAVPGFATPAPWYPGRPLLLTRNDYGLGLYNGDTGVVVARDGGVRAAFARAGGVVELAPTRLEAVDTVYAMTVHKSQGSQLDVVAIVLPGPDSPILTRELLYTAVTRARRRVILVGPEESVRAAVERPIARASGLRERLWGT